MGLFKSTCSVASINFKRWVKDIRVRFNFLFIAFLLYFFLSPYTLYGIASDQTCSVYLLPLLFRSSGGVSMNSTKLLLYVGMLLLLCDAPFFSPITPYMILRSRRNSWWLGECLYIFAVAFVYVVFITVVSTLLILPVAIWENDWGSVVYEVIFGNQTTSGIDIAIQHNFQTLPNKDVVRYLYPIQSQLYTMGALLLSFTFLGLVMYLVSLLKRNVLLGMSVAAIFIFLDPFLVDLVAGSGEEWLQIFSPVCWSSVDQLYETNRFQFMSIPLALGLYVVLIGCMCLMIQRCSKRVMIELR